VFYQSSELSLQIKNYLIYSSNSTYPKTFSCIIFQQITREYAVAQLEETLRYKPEGIAFDWDFSLTNPSDRTMTLG
jgi:hypothetical protein